MAAVEEQEAIAGAGDAPQPKEKDGDVVVERVVDSHGNNL